VTLQAVTIVRAARRSRPVAAARENARLVSALRAQDPAVARPLFERFVPTIYRLLRRTLGPEAPIDVALEVVLLCVFHRARRLQPRSDLRQFIIRETARVARADLRRRARPSSPPPRGWRPARPPAATDAAAPAYQAVMRFYRTLDRLSAANRIAFVFHHVEGIEARDIAAALGETAVVTRRRLARVLRTVHDDIRRDPVLREICEQR
jgi:DNA-directed RNA polymerase specialized sigma24 family protein